MYDDFREEFWNIICMFRPGLYLMFSLTCVLMVLVLFGFVLGNPAGSTKFMIQLDLFIGAVILLLVGYSINNCSEE